VNIFEYSFLVLKSTIFWAETPCSLVEVDFIFRSDIVSVSLWLKSNPSKYPT
jgi:hypothetical protein